MLALRQQAQIDTCRISADTDLRIANTILSFKYLCIKHYVKQFLIDGAG